MTSKKSWWEKRKLSEPLAMLAGIIIGILISIVSIADSINDGWITTIGGSNYTITKINLEKSSEDWSCLEWRNETVQVEERKYFVGFNKSIVPDWDIIIADDSGRTEGIGIGKGKWVNAFSINKIYAVKINSEESILFANVSLKILPISDSKIILFDKSGEAYSHNVRDSFVRNSEKVFKETFSGFEILKFNYSEDEIIVEGNDLVLHKNWRSNYFELSLINHRGDFIVKDIEIEYQFPVYGTKFKNETTSTCVLRQSGCEEVKREKTQDEIDKEIEESERFCKESNATCIYNVGGFETETVCSGQIQKLIGGEWRNCEKKETIIISNERFQIEYPIEYRKIPTVVIDKEFWYYNRVPVSKVVYNNILDAGNYTNFEFLINNYTKAITKLNFSIEKNNLDGKQETKLVCEGER